MLGYKQSNKVMFIPTIASGKCSSYVVIINQHVLPMALFTILNLIHQQILDLCLYRISSHRQGIAPDTKQ